MSEILTPEAFEDHLGVLEAVGEFMDIPANALRAHDAALRARVVEVEKQNNLYGGFILAQLENIFNEKVTKDALPIDLDNLNCRLFNHVEELKGDSWKLEQQLAEVRKALRFVINEWGNRGETTSLHVGHLRMKSAIEQAQHALGEANP
jgi:hypothetical protein